MADLATLKAFAKSHFKGPPAFYRAPGRVNLIGEHTDYNEGFVMPAALHFDTTIAIARNPAARLRIRSEEFAETVDIQLSDAEGLKKTRARGHWSDYVTGVVIALRERDIEIAGADLIVKSDIPLGAGLSSSASFEVCMAFALMDTANQSLEKLALAQLCQKAENDYVGTRCGIMDQFAATFGLRNHALALDCRSLDYRAVSLGDEGRHIQGPNLSIIVCNSGVRHAHAGGEYNRRRAECELAVAELARNLPGLRSLRDVSLSDLAAQEKEMNPIAWRRARHIVSENLRVMGGVDALQSGDGQSFGRLMNESHSSLRDDFEVSCRELDLLVNLAGQIDGVLGARMTGGGFGGCTVNLVIADAMDDFIHTMGRRYAETMGFSPEIYACKISDGVSRINE